ncbi:MAG: response regulator [Clostridiales bacterium]|nr:response regulator [Clostridiales bacterium]
MNNNRKTLLLTLGATFVLMAMLVTYTTRLMYTSSYSYINELGNDKAAAITADLENYLETARSVLWVAADTVDHMVANGATNEEIVEYITRESANTASQFDESYTGLYGVINGGYVDGVGWTPPDDYDPTVRDWYIDTVAAGGQPLVVSPYVDAQTGNVIISVCKALTDTNNVLGLDLTLTGVQETVENISINGNGYGFILNYDGTVVAHRDSGEKGRNYSELPDKAELFEKVMSVGKGNFDMNIDGRKCVVFVDEVLDQWHLVIVVETAALYKDTASVLIVSVLVGILVFALIAAFYIIAYTHERKTNKRIEEMKEVERKREYEAKVLMLEKSAADSANKAKSDFLADMSHEIRTPINAVLGMNEMILRESKDDNILEYSSNIKSAGNTLLSIINNILDFSKIEDGKMSLVPVEFDVAELINNLVNSISERARAKGLEFRLDIDESVPARLFGDDVRISQVIMNLLTNAVKYTETGSVTLRVANKGTEDGNVRLRIDVTDTGIGIKEEDLDKLFQSFERIEEKRNRHIEGTGLGISIVVKLLSMMDSKLEVNSKYAIGSTFGFDLSLRVVDPEPVGRLDEKKKISSVENDENGHLYAPDARVLVTDDNGMNLKVACNFLKLFGITPVTCSSGRETIDILRKEKFDIILLDHMMPEMDGIETLKVLKDDDILNGAAVIALTANAVVGAEEQYLNAGFDGYLSKPIMVEDIENTLKKYLPADVAGSDDDGNAVFEFAASQDEKTSSTLTLDKARSAGLNVDAGMGYACGEENFYLELLSDYVNCTSDKCAELTSYLDNNDIKNYEILVHSIKSASKTIGADDLSAQAKALEDASKNNDIAFVKAHHDSFIKDFTDLAGKLIG